METLTSIGGEFILQVVVGLFGSWVGGALLDRVLIQEASDLLDPLQQAVVVFVHQTLDPAARRTFRALMKDSGREITYSAPENLEIIRFSTREMSMKMKSELRKCM